MKKILILLLIFIFVLTGCGMDKIGYGEKLQSVANEMLEGAVDIEELLNQYSRIWSFSIENRAAIPVNSMMDHMGFDKEVIEEYFPINAAGNLSNDFSTNIYSLQTYYEGTGKLDEIRNETEKIKNKVSELNNPPPNYEKAYDELLDMYTFYEEFKEMALEPKESMKSFNEKKNSISSDILSKYKRIDTLIP